MELDRICIPLLLPWFWEQSIRNHSDSQFAERTIVNSNECSVLDVGTDSAGRRTMESLAGN